MKNKIIILVYKQTKNLKVLRMRKFLKETRSTNLQLKSIAVLIQPLFCFNQNLDVRMRHWKLFNKKESTVLDSILLKRR